MVASAQLKLTLNTRWSLADIDADDARHSVRHVKVAVSADRHIQGHLKQPTLGKRHNRAGIRR